MFNNFTAWWQDTNRSTKIGFGIGLVCILLLMIGGTYWVFRDDYQVLFADLAPEDASVLVSELEKAKTPYMLDNGGTSILVPKEIVYKTRLKLMGQNVPLHGGVGFEIFNNSDFGMTEFAQKVNYQRALQGELTRTILAFDEVKHARVHLVMADSGLFKKNKVKSKASVTLIMKPAATLRTEQVVGIQRLIAASVPEIEVAAVTILDHQGVALSRNPRSDNDNATASNQSDLAENLSQQLEVKKLVETHLSKKLTDVLEQALGPNQAIVSVDISLNYDQVKVTQENVLGAENRTGEVTGIVVRKRQSLQSPASLTSEAPQQPPVEGKRLSPPSMGNTNVEVDYQTGRRIEQVVSTPGSIRRISIGVLVPDSHSAEKLRTIKEVIEMTAGINPERGDAVVVYPIDKSMPTSRDSTGAMPLPSNMMDSAMPPAAGTVSKMSKPAVSDYINLIFFLLISLVIITLGISVYRRYRSDRMKKPAHLNAAERAQILHDMRTWLAGDFVEVQKRGAP